MKSRYSKPLKVQSTHRNKGQIMVLFALLATVIMLMMGAGLDIGLFYREKARISKSLDGAAIRLANRITMTDVQRRQVVGTVLANTDKRWEALSWSGSTGTTPDGLEVSYTIETFGPAGNQDAVRVTMTAISKAPVFFTSLAGIKDVKVASTSTAERFPGIIALILDVSGSMRGGTKWSNMVSGAKDFVNNESFDETRDRMAIFIFGTRAAPLYPIPDSNGKVVAQKNFRTAAITELNKLYDGSGTRPAYGFNGSTSASEGVRVAFEAVESSLPTDAADRKLFKVSYVFLTDGEFNTFRTFAVGKGYGWNGSPTSETTDGSAFVESSLGKPSWHGDSLLSVGVDGWGGLTNFQRPDVSGSTTTGSGPFNLKTLVGDKSFSTFPGVSCTIHAQNYTHPDSNSFGRWGKYADRSGSKMMWPRIWSDVIYNKSGTVYQDTTISPARPVPAFNWRHDTNDPLPLQDDYLMLRKRTGTGAFNILDSPTSEEDRYTSDHIARIRWEMLQFRYGYLLSMPSPIFNSGMNYSKDSGTNRSGANLNDLWLNYYSGAGRIYSNLYGSKVSTETGDARDRGIYIERTDSNGMTQKGSTNYNFWNRATARLTDFYPSYYYGSEWSELSSTDKAWLADDQNWNGGRTPNESGGFSGTVDNKKNPDHAEYELRTELMQHLGVPRYIYRPSTGQWVRFYGIYNDVGRPRSNTSIYENKGNMDSLFLEEGRFLTEAQCWIARIQHRAAVYTIAYEFSGAEAVLRRMANERSNGTRYYEGQKRGMFRSATASSIDEIFDEIASKIGVAITQ